MSVPENRAVVGRADEINRRDSSTTTVLGAARLVAPAETRQFFRIIDEQADRMNGLLADLLDAGRIDEGTLSVSPEPSEVGPLVDQARNTFLSGDARHAVLIDLPPACRRCWPTASASCRC